MTRSRKRKLQRSAANWAGMPLASAAFACSGVAYAQQTSPGAGLEEVIVTAQKRTEDVQKVPISITVMGTEKLEQLQVKDFLDYAKFLPSVSFKTLGPGQSQIFFRGISTGAEGLHAGYLPSSGLYLDETPVTTVAGSLDIHVYDIARVEGLAGPQGTLYGASSLAGTMRIITNKPDHSRTYGGYDIKGTKFGKGDTGGSIEGFINIPVSDKVAVRLVGYYDRQGGYTNNVPTQITYLRPDTVIDPATSDCTTPGTHCLTVNNNAIAKKNINDVESVGGRAALKIDLNDQWSVLPVVMYQDQKSNGSFAFDPRFGDLNYGDIAPTYNKDRWYQSALTLTGKLSNLDFLYSGSYFERKVDNQVDYTQYTQAYDVYAYCCYTYLPDPANPPPPDSRLVDPTQYTLNHDKYTKLSNEFRVSSPADWRMRFVTGAFFQRQSDHIRAEFRIDNLPSFYAVDRNPGVLYLSDQDRVDRDSAVFADVTYDITDRLKVSGGIRQFNVDNTLFGFFGYNDNGNHGTGEHLCEDPNTGVVILDPASTTRPCINTNKRLLESGETHKINLTWQIDPDHMVYWTYSTGYRPGGNNRRPQALTWAADTLSNYEFGWKMNMFDHRFRLNGAIFYEKWRDAQTSIQGLNGITSVVNAGDARSKGIEGDITWLPVDNLTLTLSGTYADALTTTDFCKPTRLGQVIKTCTPDKLDAPAGTRLPATPKLKANASARYKFNTGGLGSFVQVALAHQGSTTYSLEGPVNLAIGDSPGFTTYDFSVGTATKNWTLEAYVGNATDERGELGRVSECADPNGFCYAHHKVFPIKPMNFGLKFGQRF